jgi:Tol biopolymer transport system component
VYDPAAGIVQEADPPVKYDSGVWFRLGIDGAVAADFAENAESWGLVSPSGNYILYTLNVGPKSFFEEGAKTEVRLASSDGQVRRRVVTTTRLFIYKTAWVSADSKVMFGLYSPEGWYLEIYLADIRSGGVTSITDMVVDRTGTPPVGWALSPDGNYLAVTDSQCRLCLMPLGGGGGRVVASRADSPSWSHDGASLYFWNIDEARCLYHQDVTPEFYSLERYSPSDASRQTVLLDTDVPTEMRNSLLDLSYAVSPSGAWIAFWDGAALWVAALVSQGMR